MLRYVAFLRAINVGGHTVKMDQLRGVFESMGFVRVETFIASGNVVFESRSKNTRVAERKIENKLRETLGYEVATFIRTVAELAEIANYKPFQQSDLDGAMTFGIAFVTERLDDESKQKIMALRSDIDNFHVRGREIYWLSRRKQSESTLSNAVFERIIGRPATFRGANTVKRMAERYSPTRD